ncbi:hypothetical protein GKE82_06480 [Conexibacter sp. W3-3-2]|uniref:hypothetical protein n=1 Tax=Conexibacter sp. W3-3-2 TaxID=2675227 RepID=UPI0012BA2ED2|nr:hypothetical protein [Conexibacter sp. W3-3-2]MTD43957.1 hypothetical protein [Conexibacter sp. W3-3-2]
MDVVALIVVMALVAAVAWGVSRPIRGGAQASASADAARVADLLAARDAKYREIRDLELDHQTGKLVDAEFRVQDRALRAEAMEILRELDRYEAESAAPVAATDGADEQPGEGSEPADGADDAEPAAAGQAAGVAAPRDPGA